MIVYDIGCCGWGEETSVEKLVERFSPRRLIGFDPQAKPATYTINETRVAVHRKAAWTHADGVVVRDERSHAFVEDGGSTPSFDLAEYILTEIEPLVLKLDVEGGEYVLIPHLQKTGALENVSLLLVEWHGEPLEGVEWEPWHE